MSPKKRTTSKSATRLRLLHRRRTNILGSADLIKAFDDGYADEQRGQVAVRIQCLDNLWREYSEVQDEIELLEDGEEEFCEERAEFQTMYFELKASLQAKLPPPPPPVPVNDQLAHQQNFAPTIPHVKLPEIKLKEFSGNVEDWVSFRDLYISLIHTNQRLTAVQKLHYLRAALTGEAARIISSLEISADNYVVAWNLMKERFDNPGMLIKRHMTGLLSLSQLKKESAEGLVQLVDEFDRHVQLLDKLEDAASHWNSFLVERLSSCLDSLSLREWETQIVEGDRPTYQKLVEFVHKRSRMLQTLKLSQTGNTQSETKPLKPRLTTAHVSSEQILKCPRCKQAHLLFQCDQFKNLTPSQRFEFVKKHGICINCLKGTHFAKDCSSGSCRSCAKKHHTLLHLPPASGRATSVSSSSSSSSNQQAAVLASQDAGQSSQHQTPAVSSSAVVGPSVASPPAYSSVNSLSFSVGTVPSSSSGSSIGTEMNSPPPTSCQGAEVSPKGYQTIVMLSTAVVKVKDADGNYHHARALLDSGSQPSFLTEALCQKLRLKRTKLNSPVSGIGQSTVTVRYGATLHLASRYGNYTYNLDCLVMPKLTVALPRHHIDVSKWRIPRHLPLADPQFNISQGVDMIIGAELFFALLEGEQITLGSHYPLLQKTVLGYIVCGKIPEPASEASDIQVSHICTDDSLDAQLERFWQTENFDNGRALSVDDQHCETHFQQTYERDADGRYVVRLPLRDEMLPLLGDSRTPALRQFLSMEKKMAADENLRQEYRRFMEDYERLGHMEVSSRESRSPQFFLPHHAIHRPESSTTKTRVVFNGSRRSSTQLSLNDVLHTGPTVQPAMYHTVVTFRMPRYVFTADAEKMFRQIWVHPDDRKYQQIFWRDDPSEPIRTYLLKTVTYGLASSPYHATRVLNQLATDEGSRFPLAVPIIRSGVYVDDVLTGHDDRSTLEEACKQLIQLLSCAGFTLRKWASNDNSVLASIPPELWETSPQLELDRSSVVKALGLLWFPNLDTFKFKIPELPEMETFSKRIVVSEMSSLFDPLGLLGPVVVNAKMFVQTLWASKYTWDEELPTEHNRWWSKYRSEIKLLESFEVPRRVIFNNQRQYTLHCFVDASKRGFGCCVYVVSPDETGKLHSRLLTAKSRVAPLRGQTIPRLELEAVLLGSQLVDQLRQHTEFKGAATFWSDSTIVLHWIMSTSMAWKVYVSNRTFEVQRLTKGDKWNHVPTHLNPADAISRGMLASQFLQDERWKHGPCFLTNPVEPEVVIPEPTGQDLEIIEEESRPQLCLVALDLDMSLFSRFSELGRLVKTTALCFRFCHNCRLPKEERRTGSLTPSECDHALKSLVRLAQQVAFASEIKAFRQHEENPSKHPQPGSKSPLKNLNLKMDRFGLLRIDGRLKNLNAPFDTRFPILLPAGHRLTRLIARSLHLQTLHGGPSLLLATLRQRFWPLQGRQLARSIVRKCVTCFRCRPRLGQQIMAPLPAVRIKPARPFAYAGMDYCGPFFVRPLSGRGASVKVYVGLFVCMVVKAVHLEVIADLSSVACINAVKRVVARRGRILELHCDNATAFVGADRELQASRKEFHRQLQTTIWKDYCLESGITFRFIPARSPHFGGLWEAGIKSFKHHFRRIMGNRAFSMDQLLTVVSQIESVLNSRPLAPLTDSPDDLSAITPGHFLIGEPPFSIPEPDLCELNPNRLTRLQEMKRSVQDLWRCWSRDCLHQLHQRVKWRKAASDIQPGQLVLLKQDNLPPLQWPLGRIVETIPGSDGHTRVVMVKTATGKYRRAVTEVAPLPIDPDEDNPMQDGPAGTNLALEDVEDDIGTV